MYLAIPLHLSKSKKELTNSTSKYFDKSIWNSQIQAFLLGWYYNKYGDTIKGSWLCWVLLCKRSMARVRRT